jgi:hypothetical protein
MIAHDREFTKDKHRVLTEAKKVYKALGYGDVDRLQLKKRFAHGQLDVPHITGLDDVAQTMAEHYPEHFPDKDRAEEKLFGMIFHGAPKRMTEEQAYREALDHLVFAKGDREDRMRRQAEQAIPFARWDVPLVYERAEIDEALWAECQRVVPRDKPPVVPYFCGTIEQGTVNVWMVDGDEIKRKHNMDFVDAGNGLEDSGLCGPNEIYLDVHTDGHEHPFNLYHEAVERRDMIGGMSYDKAHERANAREKVLRTRAAR